MCGGTSFRRFFAGSQGRGDAPSSNDVVGQQVLTVAREAVVLALCVILCTDHHFFISKKKSRVVLPGHTLGLRTEGAAEGCHKTQH